MAFDLHRALLKKQEHECARLDDFTFRLRARSARALAEWARERAPGAGTPDPLTFAGEIVTDSDEALVARMAALLEPARVDAREVARTYHRIRYEKHLGLVAEMGDPTPHALA